MSARGYIFGHACYFDWNAGQWLYADTSEPTLGNPRPCPQCNQSQTAEGYDPCLGFLEGVTSACCGHGVTPPILCYRESKSTR